MRLLKFLRHFILYRILPARLHIMLVFRKRIGKFPDLRSPKTLNEKIQYLKLFYRMDLQKMTGDKYLTRQYLRDKINSDHLIPLLYIFEKPEMIHLDDLPSQFVIKSSTGNNNFHIVKDKSEISELDLQMKCRKWLNINYFIYSKEWQYKSVRPKILVEKLLLDERNELPYDYKFHCFHGKTEIIQVDINRFSTHRRNFYDSHWSAFSFTWSPIHKNLLPLPDGKQLSPPPKLDEMIRLAEQIAKPFPYIRVDMFNCQNQIFIGELTLHPGSGFAKFTPDSYDLFFGEKLSLSRI